MNDYDPDEMSFEEAKELSGKDGDEHWLFTRWKDYPESSSSGRKHWKWYGFCERLVEHHKDPSPVNEARLEIAAFDLVTSVEEYTDVGDTWATMHKIDDILAEAESQ